jgi:hypothetical protein
MILVMLPWSAELAGRIDEHVISSELLRGNPLGDPHERPLLVYTPPGYDDEPGRAYPAVYVIQGYTGHVAMWGNRVSFTQPEDASPLGLLGVAACFSARGDGTPELPFDPVTGVLRPDVWQRWLDWDPVRMAPRYAAALRGLRGIWIDAGTRDDFNLDVGAAAYRAALLDAGVADDLIRIELFDATHAGIDYRYPLSLAWLCERIADLPRTGAVSSTGRPIAR